MASLAVAWFRTVRIRCTTVTVLATASSPSVSGMNQGRSKIAESPVITRMATSRSARSAMPPLASMPSDSARARA